MGTSSSVLDELRRFGTRVVREQVSHAVFETRVVREQARSGAQHATQKPVK